MLVLYLLLKTCILIYLCKGCSTSKMYLYLEDNSSSFSLVSLKSKEHTSISSCSLLLANGMFFGKQKFNVKPMKMSKFRKSTWQLIISTSNSTLEVPLLRPCHLKKREKLYVQKNCLNLVNLFLSFVSIFFFIFLGV